jgi:hypothetical protein
MVADAALELVDAHFGNISSLKDIIVHAYENYDLLKKLLRRVVTEDAMDGLVGLRESESEDNLDMYC